MTADASTDPAAGPYPAHWEADVVLADGGTMHVRPILPADADRLLAFHDRQSAESIYLRFFSPRPRLSPRDVERFTHVDTVDRVAFVGLLGDDMVGVARYDRYQTLDAAEVAFFIDDAHQGRGIATVLLEYLAAAARENGLSGFTAQVLPHNRRMLSVFKQAGFTVASHFSDGVVEVELGIDPTPEAVAAMEERARRSEARSVERLVVPRSIAVIGAGRRRGTIGHDVFRHLIEHRFEGPVYAVNARAEHVSSVRAWPSVLDVPDDVDLAVIAVPAEEVLGVVEECARKRVRGLVVISAGFSETGPAGAALERRVVQVARGHGMRLIGPNCMGVINTSPEVSMHATFAGVVPERGRVALSSQSGTLGAAIIDHARQVGLGISTFVAVGNKADVSGNDLLQYWEDDPGTDVILLYLESFGNPRNFSRIARRLSRSKPIVAVKSAPSIALEDVDGPGWPPDATIDAMLTQTGVIPADTLPELFDVARVLSDQPVPAGRRVAIVSNSWSPALLAADACLGAGLELAPVGQGNGAVDGLVLTVPGGGTGHSEGATDLAHEAGPEEYAAAMRTVLADDAVDAGLVLFAPPVLARTGEVAEPIAGAAGAQSAERAKPVVATILGPEGSAGLRAVPAFSFPEAAAHALGRVAAFGAWRAQPPGEVPELAGPDPEAAADRVAGFLDRAGDGRWLDADEAEAVLATHGLAPVPHRLVGSAEDAVVAARELGHPVALKANGLPRLAKTGAGGLALDVHGDDEVRRAHERMVALLGDAMRPALVQAMASPGVDCLVGVHQHPLLGSVLTFGEGGVRASTFGDAAPGVVAGDDAELAVLPVTDVDARRLIERSRLWPLLVAEGPDAVAALEDVVLRLAALADAVPELAQVRANPVIASPTGAAITDVSVRVDPWPREPDLSVRPLS